jgi:hypothetical protein
MKYHFIPTSMAIIKNKNKERKTTNLAKNMEKLEPLYIADDNSDGAATMEISLLAPQKLKHRVTI